MTDNYKTLYENIIIELNKHIKNMFITINMAEEKGFDYKNSFYQYKFTKSKSFINFNSFVNLNGINYKSYKPIDNIIEINNNDTYTLTKIGINTYFIWLPILLNIYNQSKDFLRIIRLDEMEKIDDMLNIIYDNNY